MFSTDAIDQTVAALQSLTVEARAARTYAAKRALAIRSHEITSHLTVKLVDDTAETMECTLTETDHNYILSTDPITEALYEVDKACEQAREDARPPLNRTHEDSTYRAVRGHVVG